ncbi:MAG TPA: hypothetical protein VEA38_26140 [Terriglobales bacterium]|nr:hypothetical protein [Terriglobales bacterium]
MRALFALLLTLAAASPVLAQPPVDLVRFAADAEKARGHLLVSEELYAAGQARPAALHAAHPVHEIGNRLIGPVRRTDALRADRLRAALREPGRALDGKVPPARYAETVAALVTAIDEAVTHVVGAGPRAEPGFRARVIAALLADVVDEYEEAFKDGRIAQVVEYQDAYGFFRRARVLYDALPAAARRADTDVAALAKAVPGVEPPRAPMPAATLKQTAQRIAATLAR